MRVYKCTDPHVEEFINMMEPTTEEKGYSCKEIHDMYVSFMKFFYPDTDPLGKESMRRKLTNDEIPHHSAERRKVLYQLMPSETLLEIEGIQKIAFSGISLEQVKNVVKKEDNDNMRSYTALYKTSDRKFENSHYKTDIGSFEKFLYDRNYTMAFDKKDWIKFSDLYKDYLKYCADSIYVPANQLTVKKYLKDMTYRVIKLPESRNDSKNLYVNIHRKEKEETSPKVVSINNNITNPNPEPVQEDLGLMTEPLPKVIDCCTCKKNKFVLKPIITPASDKIRVINDGVREFIHKKTSYDEDGKMYDTRKLYAAYLYYTENNTCSFNEFRYILSTIPAARLTSDYENNTEVSRIIPEFEYLARMQEKNKSGLINMKINNAEKRITKALEEAMKIYDKLNDEDRWYSEPEKVEEKKKEEDKAKDFIDLKTKIHNTNGGEENKEESTTNAKEKEKVVEEKSNQIPDFGSDEIKAFDSVNAAMHDIESKYASVLLKYKALEDIKQTIKEQRAKVHEELRSVFDLMVNSSLQKVETLDPLDPAFNKEIRAIKDQLQNLTSFVKR